MGWLIENRPEAFEGAELLLNEGGSGFRSDDGIGFSNRSHSEDSCMVKT